MAMPTPGVISITAAPARTPSLIPIPFHRPPAAATLGAGASSQRDQRLIGETQRREERAVQLRVDTKLRWQQARAQTHGRCQPLAQRLEQRLALPADAA